MPRMRLKRLAVERFDGRPVGETEIMPLLLEAGFLAGPRRAVLAGSRRARGRCPPSHRRAAARAAGRGVSAESPHPRGGSRDRRANRRQAPRAGRGPRQEPPADVRGRPGRAEPSAHERPLAAFGRRAARSSGKPWLVLRGADWQAVQRTGPVLELGTRPAARARARHHGRPARVRRDARAVPAADQSRELGEALLDQTLVAGIGNKWKAEALFAVRLSPWVALREVPDERARTPARTAAAT